MRKKVHFCYHSKEITLECNYEQIKYTISSVFYKSLGGEKSVLSYPYTRILHIGKEKKVIKKSMKKRAVPVRNGFKNRLKRRMKAFINFLPTKAESIPTKFFADVIRRY